MGGDGKAEISLKRQAVHIFIDSFQVIIVLNLKASIIYYCYELKTFADIPQALAKDHRNIEILIDWGFVLVIKLVKRGIWRCYRLCRGRLTSWFSGYEIRDSMYSCLFSIVYMNHNNYCRYTASPCEGT